MSYDRRGDPYPPEDDRPVRRERDSLGSVEVPDLRQRVKQRSPSSFEEQEGEPAPEENERRFFGVRMMDLVFLLVLVVAAIRGTGGGCLPGKGCLRVIAINILGLVMIIAAFYVSAETEMDNSLVTGMGCVGSLICVGGLLSVVFLIFTTFQMMDLDLMEEMESQGDGPLGMIGNLFGR